MPLMLFLIRLISVTLPRSSVEMPCHSPSGWSESHPSLFVQLSPSVAA